MIRRLKNTRNAKKRRRTQNFLRAQLGSTTKSSCVHTDSDDDSLGISSYEDEISMPGELKFSKTQNDHDHVNHHGCCYHEVSYMVPVPKSRKPRHPSLTPITVGVIGTIGLISSKKLLKVLLDP